MTHWSEGLYKCPACGKISACARGIDEGGIKHCLCACGEAFQTEDREDPSSTSEEIMARVSFGVTDAEVEQVMNHFYIRPDEPTDVARYTAFIRALPERQQEIAYAIIPQTEA